MSPAGRLLDVSASVIVIKYTLNYNHLKTKVQPEHNHLQPAMDTLLMYSQ
jgi:hypothetical protein